jgi:hypothetical protein
LAASNPAWLFGYVAATLDLFCGMRAFGARGLWEGEGSVEGAVTPSPSPERLDGPTDGDRATCPGCGGTTLIFRRRHVLLSGRSGRDKNGEEHNRLRYAHGWACERSECGYRRLTDCR